MNVYIYILIAAVVSFLIRVLPLTLIRRQITNRFLRSFLYYVPYVTLAVMTFPAIVTAAQYPAAGVAALLVGVVLAWLGAGLFPVAVSCCASVFLAAAAFRPVTDFDRIRQKASRNPLPVRVPGRFFSHAKAGRASRHRSNSFKTGSFQRPRPS